MRTRKGGSVRKPYTPGRTPRNGTPKKSKRYTWKHLAMGVSAVALIVAGIYYKYPRATPSEVMNEVEAVGGKTAVETLKKNTEEVISKASHLDPTAVKMSALYNTEDAKIAAQHTRKVEKLERELVEDEIENTKRRAISNLNIEAAHDHAKKTKAALEQALERHKKNYPESAWSNIIYT